MFDVPPIAQIIAAAEADISSRLPGGDARLNVNVLSVLARMQAGGISGLYGYAGWIARNLIYDTSDDLLARWASIWGVTAKPATAAFGAVPFTGAAGAVVPAGILLTRADGVQFVLEADTVLTGGDGAGAVIATSTGVATNTAAGIALTLAQPVAGVASTVVVPADGLAGGNDAEGVDSLRSRLLMRIQAPPMGGSRGDYEAWALSVPGVTRAWVYPDWNGPGSVGVTFVMDGRADPIPQAGDVALVAAAIDAVRPVAAHTTVFAPVPVPVDFTVSLSPATLAGRAAVEAALGAVIAAECVPGGTLFLGRVWQAIANAAGEDDVALVAPTVNPTTIPGRILTMGTVTWA
jgi:uncharacterized phage protein gp47/JayE